MKSYEIEIDIKFTQILDAENKQKAIRQVKASFDDEYNLQLTDKEIVSVRLRGKRE